MRKAAANKVLVLGIDGMDPRLTRKYLALNAMTWSCLGDIQL